MGKFKVRAKSGNIIRDEIINTNTNSLFLPSDGIDEVKGKYEAFWALGKEKVEVLGVMPLDLKIINFNNSKNKTIKVKSYERVK